jgi:TorA maturation chaperone TorD
MVDGSRGEAISRAEIVGALARSAKAAPLTALADDIDEVDAARAREYALLSTLLARAPDQSLLERLTHLPGDASPIGTAHAALAEAAERTSAERVEREYFDLFIGLGRGELLPYGSYYISGFLHERPLARLRAHLAHLGIERAEGQTEPEDHAGILCEIMARLIRGELPAPVDADRDVFEQHLSPWIGRFFTDLEHADAANFYRAVGALGKVFIEIETTAFALSKEADDAPQKEPRR